MSLYLKDKVFIANHSTIEDLKQTIQKFVQSLRKFCHTPEVHSLEWAVISHSGGCTENVHSKV
jgi:hypothetical protein